jgi:ferritin-like metal-binding protein YciE
MAIIDRSDPVQFKAGRELVIRHLEDAHAMEASLVTALKAHIGMTPRTPYRALLERHLDETRGHAAAIERRLDDLGAGESLVHAALGLAETLAGQALSLAKGPLDAVRGRDRDREEKLLRNARDECASEALEIAAYDALEALADDIGDTETARVAAAHRGDEERMLAALRRMLPGLAKSTVIALTGAEPSPEPPIAGYDGLSAGEIVLRLPGLEPRELRAVASYERANRKRRSVLERAAELEGATRAL